MRAVLEGEGGITMGRSDMDKADCFAYKRTQCKVLNEMTCQYGECSFYKTTEQFKADLKKYPPTGRYAGCKIR